MYRTQQRRARRNPYLVKRRGYLVNPQMSYEIDPSDLSLIWLHTTQIDDPEAWAPSTFYPEGERFYIGAGGNTDFGDDLVFVKYKPTKIFDYDDLRRDPRDESMRMFIDCVYDRLVQAGSQAQDLFMDRHRPLVRLSSQRFDELSPSEVKAALRAGLSSSAYVYFENEYVQPCLHQFGYTAYAESESDDGVEVQDRFVNIAVLKPDFDKLEIVGLLKHIPNTGISPKYECPHCRMSCTPKEIIEGTLKHGDAVMCKACQEGADCDICGKRTRLQEIAIEDLDSWGSRERVVCSTCVETKQCQGCEGFFDKGELHETEYLDRVCAGCLGDDEDEDD